MNIDGMTFFSSKLLPHISAGPQKQKHKVGQVYFTFYKWFFLVIKTRVIIVSNTILKIDIWRDKKLRFLKFIDNY
jgi:hypothetical protein